MPPLDPDHRLDRLTHRVRGLGALDISDLLRMNSVTAACRAAELVDERRELLDALGEDTR